MNKLLSLFTRTAPVSTLIAESESRKERLEQRRLEQFTQMMMDGTHLFAGKKYTPVLGRVKHD